MNSLKRVATLVAVTLTLVSFNAHANAPIGDELKSENLVTEQSLVININKADENAIAQLKGIGLKKAQAIVAYRKAHGDFSTMDELLNVKGIGQFVLDKNRAYIRL